MDYKTQGRTLMVQFTCGRCGKTHIEPAELQSERAQGNLHCYHPPDGWTNNGTWNPLFCDECTKAYKEFLKGETK